jgi:hypothetical protein
MAKGWFPVYVQVWLYRVNKRRQSQDLSDVRLIMTKTLLQAPVDDDWRSEMLPNGSCLCTRILRCVCSL